MHRRLKILYVTHQFLPEYVAGTEILTYQTAKEVRCRGHDVFVFTGHRVARAMETPKTSCDGYDGIPVYKFTRSRESRPGFGNQMLDEYLNPQAGEHFRETIRAILPDLVHIYHLQRLSVAFIDICKQLNIPVVFTATDYWIICPTCQLLLPDGTLCKGPDAHMVNCLKHMAYIAGKGRMIQYVPDKLMSVLQYILTCRMLLYYGFAQNVLALLKRPQSMRSAMATVDRFLVPSRFMEKTLSRFGIVREKIAKIPFGVEQQNSTTVPKISSAQLRIGFIGTLCNHKGAHILCEAITLLPREAPISFKIYGSERLFPNYVKRLKQMVRDDSRVSFCGTFPPNRLNLILRDLDVLIVPSLWYENTPLVIHGAQAAHVPVVATDIGGISEIVTDGENGFLFERGNSEQLAGIIQILYHERQLVANLSKRSKPPLSMINYVNELQKIYMEILKKY
jgi:glycosyltransferase involved in cell wall biosynthesis